jgi:hypothetical protein
MRQARRSNEEIGALGVIALGMWPADLAAGYSD